MKQRPSATARHSSVIPYLCVDDAGAAVRFYGRVFGAREQAPLPSPHGRRGHAEISIGAAVVMLGDEDPERGLMSPRAIGGSPVTLGVYVADVDDVFARALEAGATPLLPVEECGPGLRGGQFEDPFGHRWSIAALNSNVPAEGAGLSVLGRPVKGATAPPPP